MDFDGVRGAVNPTPGETSCQQGLEKQEELSHVQALMQWKERDGGKLTVGLGERCVSCTHLPAATLSTELGVLWFGSA